MRGCFTRLFYLTLTLVYYRFRLSPVSLANSKRGERKQRRFLEHTPGFVRLMDIEEGICDASA